MLNVDLPDVDLSRPCDACGKMIGGGFHHCPKCKIYYCFYCLNKLIDLQKKIPAKCPMCNGEFN